MSLIANLRRYENPGMHFQLPLEWQKAKNCYIYSKKRKILDFTSSIFLANIGHGNSHLIKKIKETLNVPLLHSYNYPHKLRLTYIKKLLKFSHGDFDKVYLLTGGSETLEAALKLMRLFAKEKNKDPGIIALKGNWHGRTMGAAHLCGNDIDEKWIGYKDKYIYHLDFPHLEDLNKLNKNGEEFFDHSLLKFGKNFNFKKKICGVILEAFQGWGAINYPKDYVKRVQSFCKKNDILFAIDEMQSGFGRTGKNFCYEHYGVKPDILCCGKAMGGGFPVSGILAKNKAINFVQPGSMSSTHSANPLACAAGIAVIEELYKKKLVNKAHVNGLYLKSLLEQLSQKYKKIVLKVNCKGLIAAIIFKNLGRFTGTQLATMISEECLRNDLLVVKTNRESIKLGPPLIINKNQIHKGVLIINKSISKILKKINDQI